MLFYNFRQIVAWQFLKENDHPKIVHEMLGQSTIILTLDTHNYAVLGMQKEAASKMDSLFK